MSTFTAGGESITVSLKPFFIEGSFSPSPAGFYCAEDSFYVCFGILLAYCCRIAATGISKVDHAFLLSLQLVPPLDPYLLIHGKISLPYNIKLKAVMAYLKDRGMKHIPKTPENMVL
jgi:hypothetical protein